jgi:hypothetical protein
LDLQKTFLNKLTIEYSNNFNRLRKLIEEQGEKPDLKTQNIMQIEFLKGQTIYITV